MQLIGFLSTPLRVARRLPKTILSNRLWIFWGGSLYVSQRRMTLPLPRRHSKTAASWVLRARFYARWDTILLGRPPRPESAGIYITELGMFGNMSRRLANSLALADSLGLAGVVVPEQVIFHGGIVKEGAHVASGSSTLFFGATPEPGENRIAMLITHDLFNDFGLEKTSPRSVDRAWDVVRSNLTMSALPDMGPRPHLTIHIRGGDVFGPRKPSAYGQPPLAFYEVVLKRKQWARVTLIHEDLLNPVIPRVLALCRELGMGVNTQSGTIQEDLAVLLGAQHLVAARGTFGPAVAGLAKYCEEVFYFEDKCNMIPQRSDVDFVRVVDRDGGFTSTVLSHNWQNTTEQRDLMLSYPASSLEICD